MKKINILIILLIYYFMSIFVYADDKHLKSQQLSEVKKTIKQKEQEKEKLLLQEMIFKKELQSLNSNIERTEKKTCQMFV
jgi:hypothetical protein